MTSFEALGVAPSIQRRLGELGISSPTEIQSLAIADALAGRDLCAKAGTGSGKTLAYAIPAFQNQRQATSNAPITLILVPTRELATQVKDVIVSLADPNKKGGARVAAVYGGVSMDRQIRDLARGVEIVVATPGRLIDLIDRRKISLANIETVVIDEADRMADMGFLPPVQEILSKTNSSRQTMLFSATLDGDVDTIIRHHMHDPVRHEAQTKGRSLDNMSHFFFVSREADKLDILKTVSASARKTIVFVRTRNNADNLADDLRRHGVRVEALHGNMRQNARERVLAKFAAGRTTVLVATDVAARGIDVVGLDLVVHYELPEDHKAYIHRSGRTARAGATGAVVTLFGRSQMRAVNGLQRSLGLAQDIYKGDPEEPTLGNIALQESFSGELMALDDMRSGGSSSPARQRPRYSSDRSGSSSRYGGGGQGSSSYRGDSDRSSQGSQDGFDRDSSRRRYRRAG